MILLLIVLKRLAYLIKPTLLTTMPDKYSLSPAGSPFERSLFGAAIHRSAFAISPSFTSIHFREKAIQRELRRDVIRCQSIFSFKRRDFARYFHSLQYIFQTFVNKGELIILHHIVSDVTMKAVALKLDQVVIIESSVTYVVAALK